MMPERGAGFLFSPGNFWFFDVSSGLEEVSQGGGDEVDHGREGCSVAVAASACSGGLEQAVEAFEAGVAVGRGPALQDGARGGCRRSSAPCAWGRGCGP